MPVRKPTPGELEPIETASRDELQALQLKRLQWTLRHAYDHVPHYRAAFEAMRFHPNDVRALSDLARLPFTTKKELREHYPFGMFAVPRDQIVRIHASSGTTGKPTVVGYTRGDIEVWASVMARSIRAAGGRAGQPRVRDDLGQLVVAHLAEPRRPDKHRRVAVEVRCREERGARVVH